MLLIETMSDAIDTERYERFRLSTDEVSSRLRRVLRIPDVQVHPAEDEPGTCAAGVIDGYCVVPDVVPYQDDAWTESGKLRGDMAPEGVDIRAEKTSWH